MLRDYPKNATLVDGTEITLRPMTKEDGPMLLDFFLDIPREDRLFLRDDVTDEALIQSWVDGLDYEKIIPILALEEEKVVGDATLHFSRHYWSRHVGQMRVLVSPEVRRKGAGLLLAGEIFQIALNRGIQKIFTQVSEDYTGARKDLKELGFQEEAVLKGQILDARGRKRDMIVMTEDVGKFWDMMQDQIMDRLSDYSGG
jgi:RimJ/RimL family protein N-acetyltransferase